MDASSNESGLHSLRQELDSNLVSLLPVFSELAWLDDNDGSRCSSRCHLRTLLPWSSWPRTRRRAHVGARSLSPSASLSSSSTGHPVIRCFGDCVSTYRRTRPDRYILTSHLSLRTSLCVRLCSLYFSLRISLRTFVCSSCVRLWCVGARVHMARLISRVNLRACIQWVSAVNASNHPPAMATRGYHYRRLGRYSFHLQLWRVRVQRPWEFAGSRSRQSASQSGTWTYAPPSALHFRASLSIFLASPPTRSYFMVTSWLRALLIDVWQHLSPGIPMTRAKKAFLLYIVSECSRSCSKLENALYTYLFLDILRQARSSNFLKRGLTIPNTKRKDFQYKLDVSVCTLSAHIISQKSFCTYRVVAIVGVRQLRRRC